MKKILFTLLVFVASMSMDAQIMKIMKGETVIATYTANQADKVAFEEEEEPVDNTVGTAKRTGDIDVKWVQLWENGPKFAEYNVGAEKNRAEDFGGYYCWGKSTDKDPSRRFKEGESALTGTDDTATNLWGSNWRMPTRDEFRALCSNCYKTRKRVNGVDGFEFRGKDDYDSNSVFLPAADRYEGYVGAPGIGYYWSSTPWDSDYAWCLSFDSSVVYHQDTPRRNVGQSVRAVLAE